MCVCSIVLRGLLKVNEHLFQCLFIGSIYILKLILPILTTISKCFQTGVVSFAKIVPTLEYAKEQLNKIATTDTHRSFKTGKLTIFLTVSKPPFWSLLLTNWALLFKTLTKTMLCKSNATKFHFTLATYYSMLKITLLRAIICLPAIYTLQGS